MDLTALSTPAFLVDRDRVERNCEKMREKARVSGVHFRPHVKTHKTSEIARMQHGGERGAITVSTLAEGEFLADDGFRDITYAMPIAPEKLGRADELARRIDRLNILIDSREALDAINAFGSSHDSRFDVFLKVDCGYHRAGVDPSRRESVELARDIAASPHIRFGGLLTHAGHSYHAAGVEPLRSIARQETAAVDAFAKILASEGVAPLVRSVGSTPTLSVVERFEECDEVRPGNYVFFDAFQSTIGACAFSDIAVSVLATVVGSYPERGEAIIDAAALALSKDAGATHVDSACGYGTVCDLALRPAGLRLVALSQEHGKLTGTSIPPVGTKLRVVPNHSCLTAAMFDRYHVIEGDRVVDEWTPARGW